ncbi:class I SAM-dependent methyltransferase [Luteimonas sp. e5]
MSGDARAMARAFLDPQRPFDRHHYYYARSKLATDPLYDGVLDALQGCDAPLLDIGCGIGLLLHALRAAGRDMPYHGTDLDPRKIAQARAGMARAGLENAQFSQGDAGAGLPAHSGSVALLDVLQFLPDDAARSELLKQIIARLAPGGRLVMRTGLADGSPRAGFTRLVDRLSALWGWMPIRPSRLPQRDWLEQALRDAGLQPEFTLWRGRTPFNNWLVVAERGTG